MIPKRPVPDLHPGPTRFSGKIMRKPKHMPRGAKASPYRHRDRIAVTAARRHAFVGPARIEHRIDEPDAAGDQQDGSHQQDDIGGPAVGVGFVVVAVRVGHAAMTPWFPSRWRPAA